MKGFIVAGTGSGSGKTTACLGTLAYLSNLGYKVAPFKVGPDFIDPGHHTALTGKTSRNLDSWMLSRQTNEEIFAKGCTGADVAVVEGVMGLFDGYSGTSEAGSTAQMAKWLNLPVILIVDARSMARSAAAIVQGFENFDPDVEFAGVIFSKTGSLRHYEYLKSAVESTCRMPCLGHLPRNEKIVMPERHLGLVTSDEHLVSSDTVSELVNMIDRNTSLKDRVSQISEIVLKREQKNQKEWRQERRESLSDVEPHGKQSPHPLLRIAVARDKAFCFYYQENIEALQENGAEIVEFSPISAPSLPPDIHGIYFGGGYPELFADSLSANTPLMDEVKTASLNGMPIYGECGGFMYLCRDITAMDGTTKHQMTGCFPFSAVMSRKMRSLGYRQISLTQETLIGNCGDVLRGHEFHYSSLAPGKIEKIKGSQAPGIDKVEGVRESQAPGIDKVEGVRESQAAGIDKGEEVKESQAAGIDHSADAIKRIYNTSGRDGQEVSVDGYQQSNTLGSYLHVHFRSMEGAAPAFVKRCSDFARTKQNE